MSVRLAKTEEFETKVTAFDPKGAPEEEFTLSHYAACQRSSVIPWQTPMPLNESHLRGKSFVECVRAALNFEATPVRASTHPTSLYDWSDH